MRRKPSPIIEEGRQEDDPRRQPPAHPAPLEVLDCGVERGREESSDEDPRDHPEGEVDERQQHEDDQGDRSDQDRPWAKRDDPLFRRGHPRSVQGRPDAKVSRVDVNGRQIGFE